MNSRSEMRRLASVAPDKLIEEIESLRASKALLCIRVKTLEDALEFFAEESSYICVDHGENSNPTCAYNTAVFQLGLEKARAALEGK